MVAAAHSHTPPSTSPGNRMGCLLKLFYVNVHLLLLVYILPFIAVFYTLSLLQCCGTGKGFVARTNDSTTHENMFIACGHKTINHAYIIVLIFMV